MGKAAPWADTEPEICSLGREGLPRGEDTADAKAPSQEGQRLVEQRGHLCGWSPGTEMETFQWISHQCPQFNVSHPACMVFPSPFLLLVSVSMMPTPVA